MSKTALAWLITYFSGTVLTFLNPFYGLLTYLFEYYTHPVGKWWSKGLPDLRWSLTIAVITLLSYTLKQTMSSDFKRRWSPQTKWFILLLIIMAMVTPISISVQSSLDEVVQLLKLGVLVYLITNLVRGRREYQLFVWAYLVGSFYLSWQAFQNPKLTGGRLEGIGGPDTNTSNDLAILLITTLPFLGFYFFRGQKWEKGLSLLVAPFITNAVILCNSRGALVGIVGAWVASLVISPRGFRKTIIIGGVLGGILFLWLADPRFIERQQTAIEEGKDSGRMEIWRGGLNLLVDQPLGVGADGFMLLSPQYIPEIVEQKEGELRNVHNTYLYVGTSWGIQGLVVFSLFLMNTLLILHKTRKEIQLSDHRLVVESIALELSLVGYLVAAFFGVYFKNEVLYWLSGMTAALWNIHRDEEAARSDQSTRGH